MAGDTDKLHKRNHRKRDDDERSWQPDGQDQSGSETIRERDRRIIARLTSRWAKQRAKGMEQLAKALRRPVECHLRRMGLLGNSRGSGAPFEAGSTNGEATVFSEVWQATLECVWERVERKRFKAKGSLFSYVLRVAKCRAIDRWRRQQTSKKKTFGRGDELEQIADFRARQPGGRDENLLDDIRVFCVLLTEKRRVILEQAVILARASSPGRVSRTELVAAVGRVFVQRGWAIPSAAAIIRAYYRDRMRLRTFLKNRGYNVC